MNVLVTDEDILEVHVLIERLAATRSLQGLTRSVVAHKMRIHEHTMSALEKENMDPQLSLLQGYARALGGHIQIRFVNK